jgi:hypothetical protein
LKAAAENCITENVLAFLLDRRGRDIQITSDILKAAVMTNALGTTMLSVLGECDKFPFMEAIKILPAALYHIITCPDCSSRALRML